METRSTRSQKKKASSKNVHDTFVRLCVKNVHDTFVRLCVKNVHDTFVRL